MMNLTLSALLNQYGKIVLKNLFHTLIVSAFFYYWWNTYLAQDFHLNLISYQTIFIPIYILISAINTLKTKLDYIIIVQQNLWKDNGSIIYLLNLIYHSFNSGSTEIAQQTEQAQQKNVDNNS